MTHRLIRSVLLGAVCALAALPAARAESVLRVAMTVSDVPLTPGLATAWHVDPADNKKWIFALRQGVMFHDGSTFDADAVVWNFDKILNDKAPHYDAKQAGQARGRIPTVAGARKIDAKTIEIATSVPDAFLPYQITWILFSSPAQYAKLGNDWEKFASE